MANQCAIRTLAECYRLRDVIGSGSYGQAVLAERVDDGELVCVKQIRLSGMCEREQQEAMNEVKMLSQFDHLNIVQCMEAFIEVSARGGGSRRIGHCIGVGANRHAHGACRVVHAAWVHAASHPVCVARHPLRRRTTLSASSWSTGAWATWARSSRRAPPAGRPSQRRR